MSGNEASPSSAAGLVSVMDIQQKEPVLSGTSALLVWILGSSAHLESHDQMCEVKLSLQVQLDRNVLHACRQQSIRYTDP